MTHDSNFHIGPLLSAALILFILGLGNIYFGSVRTEEYRTMLSDSGKSHIIAPKRSLPLINPTFDLSSEAEHVRRLESRINYYHLVTLGGRFFLALSGILMLFYLIRQRSNATNS